MRRRDPSVSALEACLWSHSTFVRIHPYADGNGRLARLLSNLPVLEKGSLPILIPNERRLDYIEALGWAQDYARANREAMMERTLQALREQMPKFKLGKHAVNCHHNYVEKEHHFGADVWVTRKGAVRAGDGELGIIPGSMGAKSFIVRGKGNPDSFCSCSHGAGRKMSRTKAKASFTLTHQISSTPAALR